MAVDDDATGEPTKKNPTRVRPATEEANILYTNGNLYYLLRLIDAFYERLYAIKCDALKQKEDHILDEERRTRAIVRTNNANLSELRPVRGFLPVIHMHIGDFRYDQVDFVFLIAMLSLSIPFVACSSRRGQLTASMRTH